MVGESAIHCDQESQPAGWSLESRRLEAHQSFILHRKPADSRNRAAAGVVS